jgi:hypothetical protein
VRRLIAFVAPLLLAAACSNSGDGNSATKPSVRESAEVPAAVRAFVGRVKDPGTVAFRATYHVVRSLGGENDVDVVANPPSWQIRVGDLILVGGPIPATCQRDEQRCERGIREQELTDIGVFSAFFSTAPARALETDARRAEVGRITFSHRTIAGTTVRCAEVPVAGVVASTYCLTGEGVFALVANAAVEYEITSYVPGDPGEDAGPPFTVG